MLNYQTLQHHPVSQPRPGLHQKQHVPNGKGGHSAPLLQSAETPPGEQ